MKRIKLAVMMFSLMSCVVPVSADACYKVLKEESGGVLIECERNKSGYYLYFKDGKYSYLIGPMSSNYYSSEKEAAMSACSCK